MTKLPFDEITDLARARITEGTLDELSNEEIEDEIEDLLVMAYMLGWTVFINDHNKTTPVNQKLVYNALQTKIEGKTYQEYLEPHLEENDLEGVYRVIDTTVHQMYVQAQDDCAKENGYTHKTWRTMEDDKVREAHTFLDKVKIPVDEKFYVGEDGASKPGLFSDASLNVNCRCVLSYD